MVLFDLVKQWYWYDWLMFIIRLISSISLAFTTIGLQQYFTLPIVVLVLWQPFHGFACSSIINTTCLPKS